jgi:CTP synthase
VYQSVIERERNLKYKGKCVQVVPDIPNEVIRRLRKASDEQDAEVTVVEIGGTAGEYENILFLETARMLELEDPKNVSFLMVSYIPSPSKVGEMKTKPTQHAVRSLNSAGIQPDAIIARSDVPMDAVRKDKIAKFCNIHRDHVISAPDVESIYDVPLNFEKDHLSGLLLDSLDLKSKNGVDLKNWRNLAGKIKNPGKEVDIAIVGKYFTTGGFVLSDAYVSVIESIKYSAWENGAKPNIHWLSAEDFEGKGAKKNLESLSKYDGLIVPGGFGERGIDGKLSVIRYARENKLPYLGLCYGMQLAVIEYARNVAGIKGANTGEIDPDAPHLVVDILPDQKQKMAKEDYGGTMRLGAYEAELQKGSLVYELYGKKGEISERHRHRFEVNPDYIEQLEDAGLVFSGRSPDGKLMETLELSTDVHPFFAGSQFHPEFQAHPFRPHPLFSGLVKAGLQGQTKKKK